MRLLVILAATLIASALPAAGMAQMRGGGHFRPSFERFHQRFERLPPRDPYFLRPRPPPPPPPPRGVRPDAWPQRAGPDGYPASPPFADWRDQQDTARQQVRQGKIAPLDDVVVTLRRRSPGKILDTQLMQEGGRSIYHVQWVTDRGRRVDYVVDAATGRVLSER